MTQTIDGVTVTTSDQAAIPMEELQAYVDRGKKMYPSLVAIRVSIPADNPQEVEIHYDYKRGPFHRIRRITGYLVGTLDRFNNGKRAEERDRVKHSIAGGR